MRHYILASAFSRDFASALSDGLAAALLPQVDMSLEDELHEGNSPSKRATNDFKEKKKLAKRIMKAVQPQLETAIRAEADVFQKSPEPLLQELEVVLEAGLQASQNTNPVESVTGNAEQDTLSVVNGDVANGTAEAEIGEPMEVDPSEAGVSFSHVMDIDVHDEDAEGEDVDDFDVIAPIAGPTNEPGGEANVETQIAREKEISTLTDLKLTKGGPNATDTPPDINGYSSRLEHQHLSPPTPPISNGALSNNGQDNTTGDSATSLTEGGVPWYLKKYNPIGTSIIPERWTGREAALSEELSDMDDEELKGMAVEMEDVQTTIEEVVEDKAEVAAKVKKPKAKKRWRGYR